MTLVVGLLAGLAVGGGLVAIWWGMNPPLARLDLTVGTALAGGEGQVRPVSGWERWRSRLLDATPPSVGPDLALLGKTSEELLTTRLTFAAVGAILVGLIAVLAAPAAVWPVAAVAGAGIGWWLGLHEVRDEADKRRRTMGLALAAWTQMAAMLIKAGVGVEAAMRLAAANGTHWSFDALTTALDRAVKNRQPIWAALHALGEEVDVDEIRQVAAELRLTEEVGGSPTDALITRAETLREQEAADQMAAVKKAEIKQGLPVSLLVVCLVVYVIYPVVQTFITSGAGGGP